MVMTVENDGSVVIKVPKYTRKSAIDRFYSANLGWIAQRRQTLSENRENIAVLSLRDISKLKKTSPRSYGTQNCILWPDNGVETR